MATRSAIYEMDKVERNRFRLVSARLAKRLGVADVQPAERARQPELAKVFELRSFNDFLEGVDASLKDEGYTAAAGESLADQKAAEQSGDQLATYAVKVSAADASDSAEPATTPKSAQKATKAAPKTVKA